MSKNRPKLGEILVSKGKLSEAQLDEARKSQAGGSKRLGRILTDRSWIRQEDVARALSEQLGIPLHEFSDQKGIDPDILALIPPAYCQSKTLIPVALNGKELTVAMSDPVDFNVIQDLQFMTGMRIRAVIGIENDILTQLRKYTNLNETVANLSKSLSATSGAEVIKEKDEPGTEDLLRAGQAAPIVKLVNGIVEDAIRKRASDIHVEPRETEMQVRYRVDGVMKSVLTIPKYIQAPVTSRVKIMANLDISNRRTPQDGRVKLRMGSTKYDLRVSTLPTINGEKIVIRVLDQGQSAQGLDNLGFHPTVLEKFKELLRRPQGLILVTGPTGSGKTTTLYAALAFLNGSVANIVTVEDPVEYKIDGINQVQVHEKGGVTFASALRSILRQDPNVIFVGEIRDLETADIAFRAAQTGHLVLSTLHTNDSASAVTRLIDIGVEPFVLSSALSGVLAQRLVRRICPECKQPDTPDPSVLVRFADLRPDDPNLKFFRGAGCEGCGHEGFRGRLGVHELLVVDDFIRQKINARAQDRELLEPARNAGWKNMAEDGVVKATQGLTTLDELLAAVPPPELGREKTPFVGNLIPSQPVAPLPTLGWHAESAEEEIVIPDNDDLQQRGELGETAAAEGLLEEELPQPPRRPAEDEDAAEYDAPPRRRRSEAEAAGEDAAPRRSRPRTARKIYRDRILVIDDSPTVVNLVQTLLEAENYEVVTAQDGVEGLKMVYQAAPDLIVTDAMMPRMDGFTLVKKLKEHLSTRSIPVIILTSRDETASEVQGLELGADDYIRKPLEPERLLIRIKRTLARHQEK